MRDRHGNREVSKPEFELSPADERYLRRMGHGGLLRKLNSATRGVTTSQIRAFMRSRRALAAKFRPRSGKTDSKLAVLVAAHLIETVEYANDLSERVREIKRTKGRTTRHDVRLVLAQAYEIEIGLLRRRVEALRRNIPRLISELGGDPLQELVSFRGAS